MSSIKKKNEAAKVLQRFFRDIKTKREKLIDELNSPGLCLLEPIPIGDENVYMYLKRDEIEIPLFTIFNFQDKRTHSYSSESIRPIRRVDFFNKFYEVLYNYHLSYGKELDFIVHFTGDRKIVIKNKLRYEKNQSFIVKSIPEEHITYNDFYETYCYPYILYILANSKIDFKGGNEEMFFKLEMIHPRDLGLNPSGIHKDNSCRTCLTYVNSPLSTELAFDIENIKLGWLTCSPIFRFDTLGKFFTLCFNDYYMTHTIPIYEEEGVPVEDTNFLQDNYEIKREGDKIFFIEDGKTDGEFLIPKYRQYVSKPSERKVIVCFIEETEEDDVEYTYETLLDFSSLNAHRLPYEEEKIELTEKSIQVILEEEKIGKAAQKGGKRTKKRRRRKNRNSKKR